MSCEVRFLYLIKEDKKMKNKVLKKTLAAALALTLVSGAIPTVIGRNGLTKPAIVADAAGVGDVIYFGSHLNGCYKNYDGSNISYYDDEGTDLETIINVCDADWENSKICINKSGNLGIEELWISFPAERAYEYPTGIKIESGEGTTESPYQLKLVYEGEPIGDFETVTVGKKWLVGDLINTNAYFSVPVRKTYKGTHSGFTIDNYTVKLYKKRLSSPVEMRYNGDFNSPSSPAWGFENITLGCNANNYMDSTEWTDDIVFSGNVTSIKGIEVTGGSGTEADPFTIAPICDYKLADGTYMQYARKDNICYKRYIFVKPKSELAGKSKAVFSATHKKNVTKKFETSTYYTGMTSNGEYFTPADDNSVMFIVTVSATTSLGDDVPLDGLTCTLDFE